jgi:hypothetical protein
MPVNERRDPRTASEDGDGYSKVRVFLVENEPDVDSPEEALRATGIPAIGDAFPDTLYDMVVESKSAEQMEDDLQRYLVTVNYKRTPTEEGAAGVGGGDGFSQSSFQTGQQGFNLLQGLSKNPPKFAKAGVAAAKIPDLKGLIGWDGEKVNGVQIQTGAFVFTHTKRYTEDEVDDAYVRTLSRNTYIINDAAFAGWDEGEVLFTGATGRFSEGARATIEGDEEQMFAGPENITGVNSDNSDNGVLYLSIDKILGFGNYVIRLYKSAAQTPEDLVAENSLGSIGQVDLTSVNGSGIGGYIGLQTYKYDTNNIIIKFPFPWEITYNFAISENQQNIERGDITITEKEGWQYLDIYYQGEKQTLGGTDAIVQVATFAYVQDTYEKRSFGFLQIDDDEIFG